MQKTRTSRTARYVVNTRRRRYVLTGGCARCGKCMNPLVGQPSRNGKRSYQCTVKGCGGVRIMADALESHVAVQVLGRLATPAGRAELRAAFDEFSGTEDLTARVAALRVKLEEVAAAFKEPDGISLAAFKTADREINAEIDQLVAYIDFVEKLAPLSTDMTAEQMAAWWEKDTTTVHQRHALITSVVDVVLVHPSGRTVNVANTDRIEIRYK